MKKRVLMLVIGILLLSSVIVPLVSAQYYGGGGMWYINLGEGMRQIIEQVTSFFTPVFQYLLGDYSTGEIFFTKILFFILLSILIYAALVNVPLFKDYGNKIPLIISAIVSIIAVRFIADNDIINAIILPYGAVGIAMGTSIPFIIFGYFIYQWGLPGVARKLAWIFFGVVIFVLWSYKTDKIGDIGNQIYLIMFIVIVVTVIFDRRIAAYFKGAELKQWEEDARGNEIVNLQREYQEALAVKSKESEAKQKRILRRLYRLGAKNIRETTPP
ncbi:MAG: hypothetical protein WC796_01760 [Candidatus Pacearchaeota archaeon]|jgi:ABC-type cobalt transport system substrate-binding protein